jgi:ATP-dependent helicase/nuclease subunit B
MNTYRPMIGMVFRRHGIPVYLSGTEDILGKGAIMTALAALEVALEGFDRQTMFRYLRSPLSPVTQQSCDLIENYAHIWGITGKRWLEPWTKHPDGLGCEWSDRVYQRLESLEQLRIQIIEPLSKLRDAVNSSPSVSTKVMGIYAFLNDIDFAKRLSALASASDRNGDHRNAQIFNQLWEILMNSLEQLHDVLGNTHWDNEAFYRLFVLLLSQYDVGTIPTVLDSVTVGPVSAMRCQQEKHLLILGATEGQLPGYNGSTGILTDQERVALRKMEVPLTGGAIEGIQAEFAEVYGVFCGASETIRVSYNGIQPSYVYRRLVELSADEQIGVAELGYAETDSVAAAAFLLKQGDRNTADRLDLRKQYEWVNTQRSHTLGCVSHEHIEGIYGKCLRLSASQVNTQAECRLAYFLRYGIKAKEIKEATVDPAEYGTYVHDVLENTAKEVMKRGGFHKVTLEETMALAKEYSDVYTKAHFSELESQRVEYLFHRNLEELNLVVAELWDELHQADYVPENFELGFGDGEDMPGIDIPAVSMEAKLRGYVDRVDRFRIGETSFIRVVDYKTGSKDFDYCDIFNGVGLQMLIYLFALEQDSVGKNDRKSIPGGVQYFPARVPYINLDGADADEYTERKKHWRRKGLLLEDELSLKAMDPDETMPRLCCTRKKDGTLSGDLASRDQLKQLRNYVFMVLAGMVEEISAGIVEPNPYCRGLSHNACSYCPYQSVCHMESVPGRRNYKAMSSQRFWEEIAKVVHSHG